MTEQDNFILENSVIEGAGASRELSDNDAIFDESGVSPYLGEAQPSSQNKFDYQPQQRNTDNNSHSSNYYYVSENIKHYVAAHPEYRDLYAIPAIQNAVNAYIDGSVQTQGSLALTDLVQALGYFVDIRNALGAGSHVAPKGIATTTFKSQSDALLSSPRNDSSLNGNGRQKLRSTVDAPGAVHNAATSPSIRAGQQSAPQPSARETAWREALKLSPQEYTRWERDPKNRAIVEWVLGQEG